MKKLFALPLVLALAGCSGLHVAWVIQASYNTPASTAATLKTGDEPAPAK